MSVSSKRFEDLKDELISLKERIRIHLRRNANELTINKLFNDGDTLLQKMQIEVENCPASVQTEMNGRLFAVNNEWTAFKKTARRPALVGTGGTSNGSSAGFVVPMTRTAVLNQGIESLQNTSLSLQRAELVARESEEIGVSVMDELGSQRESLLRTRGRVDQTNADLKRSHRLIRLINTQVTTNKCLLICIIILEIMILLAIVYLRFIHKHK